MKHILGFVAYSAEWSLVMSSANDDWEDLRLSTFCGAPFGTRCFGGFKIKLSGSRSSCFLVEWASRLQGPQSTSSTKAGVEACSQSNGARQRLFGRVPFEARVLRLMLCASQWFESHQQCLDIFASTLKRVSGYLHNIQSRCTR